MRRIAIVTVAVLAALFVSSQLLVPSYVASRVASRLSAHGGSAHVELSAFPALELLSGEGDSIKVRASGLQIPLVAPTSALLGRLDKFDRVELRLTDSRSGPFALSSATLERSGSGPYRLRLTATVTGADLASYAGGQLGGELGGLAGELAGMAVPFASQPIPVDVDSLIRSDGGHPAVVSAGGTIAGLPADPLIAAVAAALAGRV